MLKLFFSGSFWTDPWDMTPLYNDSHFSLMPDGSLQIRDANRALDGVYFCSASNGFGSDIGKAVRLTVNGSYISYHILHHTWYHDHHHPLLKLNATTTTLKFYTWLTSNSYISYFISVEPPRFEARMKSKSVRKSDNIQLECLVCISSFNYSLFASMIRRFHEMRFFLFLI